jgi:hypothetical protein
VDECKPLVGGGLMGAGQRALEPHEYRQLDVQLLGAVEPVAHSPEELAGTACRILLATS